MLGVPLKRMVAPLTTAVKPVGRPLLLAMVNGPVPLAMAMTPLKPALPAVHCVVVRLPRVGGVLIVRVNVLVSEAPTPSLMVTLPAKVPAAAGVPVKWIVVPLRAAVTPAGRPLLLVRLSPSVPPLTLMVLTKPELPAVHCVAVRLPTASAGLMTMVKGMARLAPAAS